MCRFHEIRKRQCDSHIASQQEMFGLGSIWKRGLEGVIHKSLSTMRLVGVCLFETTSSSATIRVFVQSLWSSVSNDCIIIFQSDKICLARGRFEVVMECAQPKSALNEARPHLRGSNSSLE